MNEQRILEIAKRLDEIQQACENCLSGDPPWNMIDDALDLAHELLEEVEAQGDEITS